jgi:hypothetical protein
MIQSGNSGIAREEVLIFEVRGKGFIRQPAMENTRWCLLGLAMQLDSDVCRQGPLEREKAKRVWCVFRRFPGSE